MPHLPNPGSHPGGPMLSEPGPRIGPYAVPAQLGGSGPNVSTWGSVKPDQACRLAPLYSSGPQSQNVSTTFLDIGKSGWLVRGSCWMLVSNAGKMVNRTVGVKKRVSQEETVQCYAEEPVQLKKWSPRISWASQMSVASELPQPDVGSTEQKEKLISSKSSSLACACSSAVRGWSQKANLLLPVRALSHLWSQSRSWSWQRSIMSSLARIPAPHSTYKSLPESQLAS